MDVSGIDTSNSSGKILSRMNNISQLFRTRRPLPFSRLEGKGNLYWMTEKSK